MNTCLYVLLGLHLLLLALLCVIGMRRGAILARDLMWMALVPVFGPLCGLVAVRDAALPKDMSQLSMVMKKGDDHALNLDVKGVNAVPIEEALLIADAEQKRKLMLTMLRENDREYTDMLLLARYNQDTEVSHFATASIMRTQREFQVELEALSAAVSAHPDSVEKWAQYADTLDRYAQSGLLEGNLLTRQRMLLNQALLRLDELGAQNAELLRMRVRNDLALKQMQDAIASAERLVSVAPADEESWLTRLDVCVQTRDAHGMPALLRRMHEAKVEWSPEGLERLRYFEGDEA